MLDTRRSHLRLVPPPPPPEWPEFEPEPGGDRPWWLALLLVFCAMYAAAWVLLIKVMS